ncbi:MAG: SET domain-containing protein-lysine N-methyltransferase [Caldimonas sp.]
MIVVSPSNVHGLGAFADIDFAEGEVIGAYEGRRYTARQVTRRSWDANLTYLFALSDGSVIDAADGGNATRHLNHSCEPNCIAFEERLGSGRWGVVFYALRPVAAGQELTLDYRLSVDAAEDPRTFDCSCGTASCRGTMLDTA